MTIKRGILIALTGCLAAAGSVLAYGALHRSSNLRVTTAAVTRGPIARQILTTGTLQPAENVQVGSQVTGIVQSLGADFNSIVHEGQVLAKLDPSTFQAALDSAKAQLAKAQADLDSAVAAESDAHTKLARAQELYKESMLDDSDLNDAQVAYETADGNVKALSADVTVAKAAVDSATVDLQHTIITSPIDGIVTARDVDIGQTPIRDRRSAARSHRFESIRDNGTVR
jgi:HlyD family secretion protein